MKWNGYLGMALAVALAVVMAVDAQAQVNRYVEEGIPVDQSALIQPVAINGFGAADVATSNAGPAMMGGYAGSQGYGGGYGYGMRPDLSGWNQCECPAPCTAHLWRGYVQSPCRCHEGHHGHGRQCGACGYGGNSGGCEACGNGYAYGGAGGNGYAQGPGAAVNVYAQTWQNANNGFCNSCNKAQYYDRIFGNSNPFTYTPTPSVTGTASTAVKATPVAAAATQNVVTPISLPTLQSAQPEIGSGLK